MFESALAVIAQRTVPGKIFAPRIWYGTANASTTLRAHIITHVGTVARDLALRLLSR